MFLTKERYRRRGRERESGERLSVREREGKSTIFNGQVGGRTTTVFEHMREDVKAVVAMSVAMVKGMPRQQFRGKQN